jgi:hypothetical protein
MRYLNVNVHGWDIKRGACEEYPITNEINTDLKFVTWGSSEVGEPSFMALITVLVAARQEEKSDVTYRLLNVATELTGGELWDIMERDSFRDDRAAISQLCVRASKIGREL